MTGLDFTPGYWLLALLPLLVLLFSLLILKIKAHQAGAVAMVAACIIGWLFFGGDSRILTYAALKGLSLSLYVVLIIWASVFLFNIVERIGSIAVITEAITRVTADRALLCLLMAWSISGLIQGIAGFGVPVSIVAPLMTAVGFNGAVAAVATLVGHAWSISFGSMAASFYTIQLVTRLDPQDLALWMGLQFIAPTILSGFAVAHIYGGFSTVKRMWKPVLFAGLAMSLVMLSAAVAGAHHLASFAGGLSGVAVLVFMARKNEAASPAVEKKKSGSYLVSFLPYLILFFLILTALLNPYRDLLDPIAFAPDFPALETAHGYRVAAEEGYAAIKLFAHPAPLILFAVILTYLVQRFFAPWPAGTVRASLARTARQCIYPTLGIAGMLVMALVMNDTGMTSMLALGVARVGRTLYPLLAPFIGVLGCFMTGSNTNSNVIFGGLQLQTALALGLHPYIIAAVQSVGGSLGSSIAPAKVLVGTASVGLEGREHEVFRRALPYCLLIVSVVGLLALLLGYLFPT